jgi:hypothetical protein
LPRQFRRQSASRLDGSYHAFFTMLFCCQLGHLWHKVHMLDECNLSLLPEPLPSPPTGDDYRDLAQKIRQVAAQTRLPLARREVAQLATSYDRMGNLCDRRGYQS